MKKIALLFVFIALCLNLFVFKGLGYAQQGTIPLDFSKLLDPRFLYPFPPNQTYPPSFQTTTWPPSQFTTMGYPNIPNMTDYSFLFGNSWYLWQMYSYFPTKRSSKPKENTSAPSNSATTLDSELKFSIEKDKQNYNKSEIVKISLILKNIGPEEITIVFHSEQKLNVNIKNKAEQTVRHLSSDIEYMQPSTSLTLQPNETETVYVLWDQEDDEGMIVPSGTYTVEAYLNATNDKYKKTIADTISIASLPRFPNCTKLKERLKKLWEDSYPTALSSNNGDGNGGGGGSKVSQPSGYYGGYGYGGYGAAYGYAPVSGGYGGYGAGFMNQAFSPFGAYNLTAGTMPGYSSTIGGGYGLFAPSYGGYGGYGAYGGYGLYSGSVFMAPSFGGVYSSFGTGYSSLGGGYGIGIPRWKTASDGHDGVKGNSDDTFSTTNIQVIGVDEADIVKNDGTYIYMIRGKTVRIIKGSPADSMEELNVISLEGYTDFDLKRLYISENILVVIGEQALPSDNYYEAQPPGTRIFIYNITDPSNEILERKLIFWGAYVQSRKVGNTLYVIMNEAAPLKLFEEAGTSTNARDLLPHFHDSTFHGDNENNDEIICDCDKVSYLYGPLTPYYLVVIGIPLDDHTKEIGREVILDKSNHIYATPENLYVSSEYTDPNVTIIYKFWFKDETIVYCNYEYVSGKIINQFSMDEYEDHLRIATTSESGPQSVNNIYIFDSGMEETGSLKDFTSGGSIRSIRFEDDRCYAVISRDILPLNVISMTDPTDPINLTVLDIFGGTEYLHPFDENRILGFGRETVGSTEMGMKISFYDFSDVSNPQQICEDEIIGSLNTESDVFTDHKALLLSTEKNLMAFPVSIVEENGILQYIFQGANIYYIDETGFENIDKSLTHYPDGTFPTSSYNDSSQYHITRIIYMGDYYYIISKSRITARDILTHTDLFSILLE